MRWQRFWTVLASAIGTLFLIYCALLLFSDPGIVVQVRNDGAKDLNNVLIHVADQSYQMGTVKAAQQSQIRVYPERDSGIQLSVTPTGGRQVRLNAGSYVAPGYTGTIVIRVEADKIVFVDIRTRIAGLEWPFRRLFD